MFTRAALATLALLALTTSAGCAASTPETSEQSPDATEDALRARDFKKYGMAVGIVAIGEEARALHQAISENGGKDLGNHAVLAGLTALDLGLAEEGDDDADEAFGIACQAAEGDSTFHADTCSMTAIVEMDGQEPGTVKLSGKLAKAVAAALPRTSPEGLVGSVTVGAGQVSCKTIPGPTGSTCSVAAAAALTTFEEMVNGEEATLKAADARKVIKAFFPGV